MEQNDERKTFQAFFCFKFNIILVSSVDVLTKLLNEYNTSKHRSIKLTPVEASKKTKTFVYLNLFGTKNTNMKLERKKAKFEVGDKFQNMNAKFLTKVIQKIGLKRFLLSIKFKIQILSHIN